MCERPHPQPINKGDNKSTLSNLAGQTDGETTDTPKGQRGGDGYSKICRDHLRYGEQTNRPSQNRQRSVVDKPLALIRLKRGYPVSVCVDLGPAEVRNKRSRQCLSLRTPTAAQIARAHEHTSTRVTCVVLNEHTCSLVVFWLLRRAPS